MKSINKIIKDYIRDNGLKQKDIAKKVGIESDSSFSQMLKNNSLNSDLILKISIECNYDFFAEMSRDLRKEHKHLKSIANTVNSDNSELENALVDVLVKRFPKVFK